MENKELVSDAALSSIARDRFNDNESDYDKGGDSRVYDGHEPEDVEGADSDG